MAADDGVGAYRRLGFEPFGQVTARKPAGIGLSAESLHARIRARKRPQMNVDPQDIQV